MDDLLKCRIGLAFCASLAIAGNVVGAWEAGTLWGGWVGRAASPVPPLILWLCIESLIWVRVDLSEFVDWVRVAITAAVAGGSLLLALENLENFAEAAGLEIDMAKYLLATNEGGLIMMTLAIWKATRNRADDISHVPHVPHVPHNPADLDLAVIEQIVAGDPEPEPLEPALPEPDPEPLAPTAPPEPLAPAALAPVIKADRLKALADRPIEAVSDETVTAWAIEFRCSERTVRRDIQEINNRQQEIPA